MVALFSGGKLSQKGIAIAFHKTITNSPIETTNVKNSLILVKLKSKPIEFVTAVVCMPINSPDKDVRILNQHNLNTNWKRNAIDQIISLGDWNAVAKEML